MNRLSLFLVLTLLLTVIPAFAGVSTNGGSFTKDQNNVWNLGQAPVNYCVSVDPEFPLSEFEVQQTIAEAFQDWRKFFEMYGLDKMKFGDLHISPPLELALNYKRVADCKDVDDIQFMVGTPGSTLEGLLPFDEHSGLGFAIRQSFNHRTFRNGGTVWIPNFAFKQNQFKHMILHELGHIFGMEHDSVHVMDAKVADRILQANSTTADTEQLFGTIETPTWFYKLRDGQHIDFTFMGRGQNATEPNTALSYIRDIIGFSEKKFHKLTLIPRRLPRTFNKSDVWSFTLAFQEKESSEPTQLYGQFLIQPSSATGYKGMRGPVLYTMYDCPDCGPTGRMMLRRLDRDAVGLDAAGYFRIIGTTVNAIYPAMIEQKLGLAIQIFIPERSGWWSTANYTGSYFLKP